MGSKFFQSTPTLTLVKPSFPPRTLRSRSLRIRATNSDDAPPASPSASPSPPPPVTPPETVRIRFRRRSKKRRQAMRENDEMERKAFLEAKKKEEAKGWEEMDWREKATELYMGEKGLLFWLNKFAYASIFIVIGGWILFRFVGPSLNFYQLDTPPLSPTSMFKGS